MKIFNKYQQEDSDAVLTRYDFDSIENVNDLAVIINSLANNGYHFLNFTTEFERDHSDFEENVVYSSFESLCEGLGNGFIPLDLGHISARGVYMNDQPFYLGINFNSKCFAITTEKKSRQVDLESSSFHL